MYRRANDDRFFFFPTALVYIGNNSIGNNSRVHDIPAYHFGKRAIYNSKWAHVCKVPLLSTFTISFLTNCKSYTSQKMFKLIINICKSTVSFVYGEWSFRRQPLPSPQWNLPKQIVSYTSIFVSLFKFVLESCKSTDHKPGGDRSLGGSPPPTMKSNRINREFNFSINIVSSNPTTTKSTKSKLLYV